MARTHLNYITNSKRRRELVSDVIQKKKADLILANGRILNVYTREIAHGDIVVYGDRIGFIGDGTHFQTKQRIDVRGSYLTPGLLDGHLHIDSCMVNVTNFARGVLPLGTTTVFIDSHEIGNALGLEGVRMMVEEGRNTPLRVFQQVPSQVPCGDPENQTPNFFIGMDESKELYRDSSIVGLGEVSKYRVLVGDHYFTDKIEWILDQGGYVEGNAHDFTGLELQAYVGAGLFADHEAVSAEHALERARAGLYVLIREGTTENNLASIIPIFLGAHPPDTTQFAFCSDDRHPTDIVAEGHINFCIQRSIELGLDSVTAIQMATINCARNFGIDRELGGLAPGKLADILVVDDLKRFNPRLVIVGGRVVAEEGKIAVALPHPSYPTHFLNSVKVSRSLSPSDFRIQAPDGTNHVNIRVIEARERRIWSEEGSEKAVCIRGEIPSFIEKDALKLVVVERYGRTEGPNIGLGFIRGFGFKRGAIASSIDQDIHHLIAVGASDEDIAVALNRVVQLQGGLALVVNRQILGELPLPIGGLMANRTVEDIANTVWKLGEASRSEMGGKMEDPFACLQFQGHPMIPALKLSDKGLMDTKRQKLVSLTKTE